MDEQSGPLLQLTSTIRIRYESGAASEVKMQKRGKGFTSVELIRRRKGFSLVEAVMVVLFIGILAAVAIPRLNFALISKHKAEAAAKKIVTGLRLTRRLAIANAAINPTNGFEIQFLGPLSSYTSYGIWDRSTFERVDSHTIDPDVTVSSNSSRYFRFGPLGNQLAGSDLQLTVAAEGKTFTITVIPATGIIKCTEN